MNQRKRPHANIVQCPLYHAMHASGAPSCFSARLDDGLCKVDLGASYQDILAKLNRFDLSIAAMCEWQKPRTAEVVH
jgi:hypothetical protein